MLGPLLIDILIGCILARGVFTGRKSGIIAELIKLIGVLSATFVAFHYYARLGDFLREYFFVRKLPSDLITYIILSSGIVFLFYLIREGWTAIVRFEIPKQIDKWIAVLLSLTKSFLLCGLVFFGFLLAPGEGFLLRSAQYSVSKNMLADMSIGIYSKFYADVAVKFFPDEKINGSAFKALKRFYNEK